MISNVPSDTHFRVGLDKVELSKIKYLFGLLISKLQYSKVLDKYKILDRSIHISIDGTGYFHSDSVHCENCCTKNHSNGTAIFIIMDYVVLSLTLMRKMFFPLELRQ